MNQSADAGPGQPDEVVPVAILLVKSGFYEGLEVPLAVGTTVIGRGRRADIVLAEPTISREHAVFRWSSEGWYVEDLGSTNGSFANGVRIQSYKLKQGDEIVMGKLVVEVTLPGT